MYCVLCVDFGHELCVIILMDFGCITLYVWTLEFGHELCVKWCICHCFVELYICYAL